MYHSKLDVFQTQKAIEDIKKTFQYVIEKELNLKRISAPLFVASDSGLNDHLADNFKGVSFYAPFLKQELEIVQSLAKWKRIALKKYDFHMHTGLYTDMNAIRRFEKPDFIHSIYVDQWDWESVISKLDYNEEYLIKFIKAFYQCLYVTEVSINLIYPQLKKKLPEHPFIITSQALLDLYPNVDAKQREYLITKEHKAVFILKIGDTLSDDTVHDLRAPDYDNWSLNCDLLVYHEPNDIALELMSMGIRVDDQSLLKQMQKTKDELSQENAYYKGILNNELPLSIGGGIGQSRLSMFLLEKVHIGEVQVSVWDPEEIEKLAKDNIFIL